MFLEASAIAGQTLTAQAGKVLDSKNAHFAKGMKSQERAFAFDPKEFRL